MVRDKGLVKTKETQGEPVEISLRMGAGEWTRDSLAELTGSYRRKLKEMGAPDAEIETEVDESDDGSVRVRVRWPHTGVHTFAEMTQAARTRGIGGTPVPGEDEEAREPGGAPGEPDVAAINSPPTARARKAEKHQQIPDAVIYTDAGGETHVEDVRGSRVRPKRHL